jgi:hypothetical protein
MYCSIDRVEADLQHPSEKKSLIGRAVEGSVVELSLETNDNSKTNATIRQLQGLQKNSCCKGLIKMIECRDYNTCHEPPCQTTA